MRISAKELPVIFQSETTECGLACLTMVANYYGKRVSLTEVRAMFPGSLRGLTLRNIVQLSEDLGLTARPIRLELDQLSKLQAPALLHWNLEHFVVLKSVHKSHIVVHDPACGMRKVSFDEVSQRFSGIAVELSTSDRFIKKDKQAKLGLSDFFQMAKGLVPAQSFVVMLTLVMELINVVNPLFVRSIIENGVQYSALDQILIFALSYGCLVFISGLASFLRSLAIFRTGALFNFQFTRKVFAHLLRLPVTYFEKRQVGDLIDRYQVVNDLRTLIVSEAPFAILDGIFSLLMLAVLFSMLPLVGGVTALFLGLYLMLRLVLWPRQVERNKELIYSRAEENGHTIETIKNIQALKATANESIRESLWLAKYSKLLQAQRSYEVVTSFVTSMRGVLIGLDMIVCIFLVAQSIVSGSHSLGTLLVILMYKGHLSGRSTTLIDRIFQIRLAGVNLDRLSDIVLSEPEQLQDSVNRTHALVPYKGGVEFRDVMFKYAPYEPWVFSNPVNLNILQDEFVVVIGPSGAGKSTLARLILGFDRCTSGQVLIEGQDVLEVPVSWHRRQIGSFLQGDTLLVGSVAENICFFDPKANHDHIEHCARMAEIEDLIENMPMRYDTRIGEIGSGLSAGQQQRLLVARAIYGEPKILLLDEATSHLDPATEKKLIQNLCRQSGTKIVITHDIEALSVADRILEVIDGEVRELSIQDALSRLNAPEYKEDIVISA